jgi:prepilin-type N-terminal cleavage/methylation domain-containing protein
MKHRRHHGFTLIEVLAVIVIILVIAGWIVSAARTAQVKASRSRADGEIKNMGVACENFKVEYGSYPRLETVTEMETGGDPPIDPQKDGDPNTAAYKKSSLYLYIALSGDDNQDGKLTQPEERAKGFMDFQSNAGMLSVEKDADGKVKKVNYIQDPFGYSYGYSTAGAKQEADFVAEAKAKGNKAKRASKPAGYNPTYDLWSTGGRVTPSNNTVTDADRNAWVKNW